MDIASRRNAQWILYGDANGHRTRREKVTGSLFLQVSPTAGVQAWHPRIVLLRTIGDLRLTPEVATTYTLIGAPSDHLAALKCGTSATATQQHGGTRDMSPFACFTA